MTLSIGPATDYLYGLAQQAVVGVTVNGKPVLVVDGWPSEVAFGMFAVGLSQPPPDGGDETTGSRPLSAIGNLFSDEDYTIPCFIDVRVNGTVQKAARDAAESILNAFGALLDQRLGGILRGGPAEIANLAYSPSNVGTAAEPGRRQLISFGVHCTNLAA